MNKIDYIVDKFYRVFDLLFFIIILDNLIKSGLYLSNVK